MTSMCLSSFFFYSPIPGKTFSLILACRSAVLDLASLFVEGAKEDLIELIYNLVRQSFQVFYG